MRALEVDTRLLGMVAALFVIWLVFDLWTDGRFLTPRNLFNLSVQTASVAVMATGMVFVIVARHIDLSVGATLGLIAMIMGVVQAEILPMYLGFNDPSTWIITVVAGLVLGAAIGGSQGYIIGYLGVPAFIVTLGGLLVWRGAAWWVTQGRTVAPLDETFIVFGGGIAGTLGSTWSWVVGAIAVALIIFAAIKGRRQRKLFDFPLKPMWAEHTNVIVLSCVVMGFVWVMNSYPIPARAARRMAEARGVGKSRPKGCH